MFRRDDTRITPETPKAMTPTIEIPDEVSLKQMKRDFCLLDPVQTICSELPGTPVKNLPTQNHSLTCKVDDGDGNPPEIFFDPADVHSASGSSTAAHQEARVYTLEAMPEVVRDDPEGVEPLLSDLMDDVLGRLPMLEVIQLRSELGKALRDAIHRPAFLRNRPRSEGEFSPSFFMTDDEGALHWHGYDTLSREWTRLPSLNFAKSILQSPDPGFFKDCLVAGDGGLLCINVGKASGREKLVVCNPLIQQVKVLPPLNYARHPVLMHLKVDHDSGHYKVIVAGSAAIGTDALSLKTEEHDSRTGVWECPDGSDLPCQAFGLNEYQNGVYFKDSERELLMCVAIIGTGGRGVLVYDITKKTWARGPHVKQLYIPLVGNEPNVSHLATTQIVECGGSVFVFSEQECGRDVYFLIHKLIPEGSGDFTWDEVMRRKRSGGRGLLVYPEFTCVPVSEHELCFFNTREHNLEIIDLSKPMGLTRLIGAPTSKGNRFHSLNPIGFVFRPSFKSVLCPERCDPEILCDLERREYCSECQGPYSESLRSDSDMNVGSKTINCQVVIAPIEEANTTTTPVEFLGSEEEFFENAYKELQFFEEVLNFLDQV